jgi:hypothetical protein
VLFQKLTFKQAEFSRLPRFFEKKRLHHVPKMTAEKNASNEKTQAVYFLIKYAFVSKERI